MSTYHTSVLLQEALDQLNVKEGKKYIDATLGGGGHTKAIIERGGIVLGIDRDSDALEYVKKSLELRIKNSELKLVQGNFNRLWEIAKGEGFEKVDGILFDLGISGHQVDERSRGFSLLQEGPLDMRMDRSLQVSARDLVNGLNRGELANLLYTYAEESWSKKIADAIVEARKIGPIETTKQLAHIIEKRIGRHGKIHPATKAFQALRMAVNDELHSIEEALPQALELLENCGRLVVISFHSLEDRIIKNIFKEFEKKRLGIILTNKPITPTHEEERMNARARSAKLRAFEKNEY